MSVVQRYKFLAIGCIAHAALLKAVLFSMGDIQSRIRPSLHDLVYYSWYLLILAWFMWSIVLWRFRSKNIWSVVLPMGVGLLIMIPVIVYAFVVISIGASGGRF
jgi:hypothetical protein